MEEIHVIRVPDTGKALDTTKYLFIIKEHICSNKDFGATASSSESLPTKP